MKNKEVYFIRDNKIYKAIIVRYSKKGNPIFEFESKETNISISNVFETKEEAEKELDRRLKAEAHKERKQNEEFEKVKNWYNLVGYREFEELKNNCCNNIK